MDRRPWPYRTVTYRRELSAGYIRALAGMTSVEWKLEIVADGVEEGNDEKFKLFLENATNAVLGQFDKTQINLIDFEDGTPRSTALSQYSSSLSTLFGGRARTAPGQFWGQICLD